MGTDAGRVRQPDERGFADRDGVRVAFDVYDSGDWQAPPPTVLLMPTWSIIHSRFWKAQIPFLARQYRVVTFDGRGSGRSSRPVGAAAYENSEFAADTVAVMDATRTDAAVLVALSCAVEWSVRVASAHPERVLGLFVISPSCGFAISHPARERFSWEKRHDTAEGWAKYNKHYWLEGDLADFRQFFFTQMVSEPHSTKQIEDLMSWSADISGETLVDTRASSYGCDRDVCEPLESICSGVRCPVSVVHGAADRIRPPAVGERLAELTGGSFTLIEDGGHALMSRDPVKINLMLQEFVDSVRPRARHQTWGRALSRQRRVLYLSSPIGLGHARRDVAIAAELRRNRPELQLDWLAQHPVTAVLAAEGERVHPASALLANESGHIEAEAGEHDLHAFEAIRRMDEILVNNFMVFHEVVTERHYDLVVGDEAWDVDYFLHENPELKRFAFAWMTDFVGWLPMPDGGEREAMLTADYNAEMIEQRARFKAVRDRSIFVGNPDDVVRDSFGPGLPSISDWTAQNFEFAGYVTGFEPPSAAARQALRRALGYRGDDKLCVVTVGGSGVGAPLLRRILDAAPLARRLVPGLRFLVVCGPRIDPESLPRRAGVRVRGYVPNLHEHLAASDIAVVQGGLTTCMELTAAGTPFIYIPLGHHFEQNFHVRRRLERYNAGRHMTYAEACDPTALAEAIVKELAIEPDYRPVETDGASRAARMLADLL